jgi:hypothetical protein
MNAAKPITVTSFFLPSSRGTEVHLLHTGRSDTAEWEEARQWFEKAWIATFAELEKHASQMED